MLYFDKAIKGLATYWLYILKVKIPLFYLENNS